jgi:4-amino-4-deoxy-L-arabinose transferase-like glycosyltransferase
MPARRRSLLAIVLLAAALHTFGIARSILPAQDGLKYVKIARAFQVHPWADVVRGTDQHPLYPALVALAEPVVAAFAGQGPDTWRIAAQLVSALAALALLVPLHGLARRLFGDRVANLTALGFVLLPLPMTVGHDTLSDSLALFAFALALRLGLESLDSERWEPAVGCGVVAGLGFLARPEVLVAVLAVVVTGGCRAFGRSAIPLRLALPRTAVLAVAFLAVVGSYALVKGEVSEKLALRRAAPPVRKAGHWLPKGLDDPHWDFSPKEEPAEVPRRRVGDVLQSLALQWSDGLGGILAFFGIWGLVRDGHIRRVIAGQGERPDPRNTGRVLVAVYLALFTLVLVRHELRMGYLSDRHTLTLVTLSLPWAAAGVFVCARGLSIKLRWTPRTARVAGIVLLTAAVTTGIIFQLKPAHTSRWGHRAAGRWLAANAKPGQAVLDTRGWASFVSGLPSYDYWHVRQALTDARLAYVVVGADELKALSRRAETLRAVLAYVGTPAAGFPERNGGRDVGVWVYRLERPDSWEGLRR